MTNPDRIKARIEFLYERYTNATATRAELAEFFEYASDPANEAVFESLMSGSWDELYQKGRELDQTKQAPVHSIAPAKTGRSMNFRRIAAAASVILLLGAGAFYKFSMRSTKDIATAPESQPAKPDIAPGTSKAVLTLSNGSIIILDSAQKGLLAIQSGTDIIKTGSGQLAYNISKEKSTTTATAFNTLSTPRGGQFQLTLPDGTKVWLNAASSITYPTAFTGNDRKVTITGEAYFEVVHNANTPFRVTVNETEIEDIGTRFNINAYPDELEMKTTLIEGSVKVINATNKKILKPGQQIQINRDGEINVNSHADIDQTLAWKNGLFNFNGASLETVLRQLSRWYDVDIVYNAKIPAKKFGGEIQRDLNLSEVLEVLKETGVHYKIENKKLYVMP